MSNATVRAVATGLPTLTPDQAIANLRAGLDAHFADPIHAAIERHRTAYDAFQVAPEGDASLEAEDAYDAASDALTATACATRFGALALLAHLRWWLTEESDFADGHQPAYGIAQARAADLSLFLGTRPTALEISYRRLLAPVLALVGDAR
jgi:hypothetical protein